MYSMTGNNTSTRKKASAVFFALVMVVSMGAAGFAGSAAAQESNQTVQYTHLTDGDYDAFSADSFTDADASVADNIVGTQSNATVQAVAADDIASESVVSAQASNGGGAADGEIEDGETGTLDIDLNNDGSTQTVDWAENDTGGTSAIDLTDSEGNDLALAVEDGDTITLGDKDFTVTLETTSNDVELTSDTLFTTEFDYDLDDDDEVETGQAVLVDTNSDGVYEAVDLNDNNDDTVESTAVSGEDVDLGSSARLANLDFAQNPLGDSYTYGGFSATEASGVIFVESVTYEDSQIDQGQGDYIDLNLDLQDTNADGITEELVVEEVDTEGGDETLNTFTLTETGTITLDDGTQYYVSTDFLTHDAGGETVDFDLGFAIDGVQNGLVAYTDGTDVRLSEDLDTTYATADYLTGDKSYLGEPILDETYEVGAVGTNSIELVPIPRAGFTYDFYINDETNTGDTFELQEGNSNTLGSTPSTTLDSNGESVIFGQSFAYATDDGTDTRDSVTIRDTTDSGDVNSFNVRPSDFDNVAVSTDIESLKYNEQDTFDVSVQQDGEALEGAQVALKYYEDGAEVSTLATGTTDAAGERTFQITPPGSGNVTAEVTQDVNPDNGDVVDILNTEETLDVEPTELSGELDPQEVIINSDSDVELTVTNEAGDPVTDLDNTKIYLRGAPIDQDTYDTVQNLGTTLDAGDSANGIYVIQGLTPSEVGDIDVRFAVDDSTDGEFDRLGTTTISAVEGDNLNVQVSPENELTPNADNYVDVSVVGADGLQPDGSDAEDSNALTNATIELSGSGVDQATGAWYEDGSHANTGDATGQTTDTVRFDPVRPESGENVTVTVTAYANDGTEYTYSEELTSNGDLYEDLSPTQTAIDDTEDFSVQVTNTEGTPLNNRVVKFEHTDGSGFNVSAPADNDPYVVGNTLTIDGTQGIVQVDGTTVQDFGSVNNGEYLAENVTLDVTDTDGIDIEVENSATETRVNVDDVIPVTGVEAYEVSSNRSAALAGAEEFHNLTITENGAEVNGSALDDFTLSAEPAADTTVLNGPTVVDTDGDGTNDALQVEVRAENATAPLNITVNDGDSRTGSASLDVVEPDVSTTLGGDDLTFGLTDEFNVTVEDPRDGSGISGAVVDLDAVNATYQIDDDVNDQTGADATTDGNSEDVTVNDNGTLAVSVAPEAGTAAGTPQTLNVSTSLDAGTAYGETAINTGNISLGDVPDNLDPNSEESLVLEAVDANGDQLDLLGVEISGTGLDGDSQTKVTDEGFVNFDITTSDSGTITYTATEAGASEIDLVSDTQNNGNDVVQVAQTNVLEQVNLTLTADSTTVEQDGSAEFTLTREDFDTQTSGSLTVTNASGDTVQTVSIDQTANVTFSEAGNYTVTAEKPNRPAVGKAFLNDTVDITVEPSDFGIVNTTLEPDTVTSNTTNDHTLTFDALEVTDDGNTDTFTVDFGPATVDNANSVSVVDAAGENVSVTGSPNVIDNGSAVTFDVSPDSSASNRDLTVEVNATVTAPDVANETTADVTVTLADSSEGETSATTPLTVQPVDVEPAPTATVTFNDQTVTNGSDTVTVDSANLSEGGFVAIHSTPVNPDNGTPVDTVVGVSEYLGNGTSENITVTLDEPLTENQTLVAMPHLDTNGNEVYDFVTSNGSADGPYTEDGAAVVDTASITVETVEGPDVITEGGEPAQDLDDDGVYEDVDGDGELTIFDVQALFDNRDDIASENVEFFDFDDNGEVDIFDVQQLFDQQQDA